MLIKIRDAASKRFPKQRKQLLTLDDWSLRFVENVGRLIEEGRSLSTKQSTTILRLIDKTRSTIIDCGWAANSAIDGMLSEPQFRQPLYESTKVPKEIRHIGGNLLAFRFKYNDEIVKRINMLGTPPINTWLNGGAFHSTTTWFEVVSLKPRFDWLYKLWIVSVHRFNISQIMGFINSQRFTVDDKTAHYLRLARNSLNRSSMFAIDKENDILLANVCDDTILAGWMTEIGEGITL